MVDKNKKYIIIGFPKCGSTSLESYLLSLNVDVVRHESLIIAGSGYGAYHDYNPIDWYKKNSIDRTPIIILRNPVERSLSLYHYKKHHQKGDALEIDKTEGIEEALKNRPYILEQSNYDKFLKDWQEFNPIVFYFEDMIKEKGFPKINGCDCVKKNYKEVVNKFINFKPHSKYE